MNEVLLKLFLVIVAISLPCTGCAPTSTNDLSIQKEIPPVVNHETEGKIPTSHDMVKKVQQSISHKSQEREKALSELKELEWKVRIAAESGNPDAQFTLGEQYEKPYGNQNFEQAVKWYTLSANQGNVLAQKRLGEMYRIGLGVTQDYNSAIKWYTMAAYQGDIYSQRKLGLCYIESNEDYIRAYAWLTMAAEQGSNLSRKKRDEISKKMTPEQLAAANELINEIKAR